MHFRPIPGFWAYVFLSGKSADPNPPTLLVENSTIFFKPSLIDKPKSYSSQRLGFQWNLIYQLPQFLALYIGSASGWKTANRTIATLFWFFWADLYLDQLSKNGLNLVWIQSM